MSEYKGIKGFSIQSLSADPADPNIGQVWYNSTSGSWKVTSYDSRFLGYWWKFGYSKRGTAGGAGTQTAALCLVVSTPTYHAATEEYNGSTWTSGGNLCQQEE
jgi:hypothetical protein